MRPLCDVSANSFDYGKSLTSFPRVCKIYTTPQKVGSACQTLKARAESINCVVSMEVATLAVAGNPPLNLIAAQKFVRKMRGGSQSCLVCADDGAHYILKMLENPQGSNILFHEALGSDLMRRLGFPVPAWSMIHLSQEFIAKNPGMWFQGVSSSSQPPPPGQHFGSKMVMGPNQITYEFLPRSWFGRITNREDLIGAWLFDLWTGQDDCRQAVFVEGKDGLLRALFIDHGSLFSNTSATISQRCLRSMFLDVAIYEDLDTERILRCWQTRIRDFDIIKWKADFDSIGLPREWYTVEDCDNCVQQLIDRQACLDDYCASICSTLSNRTSRGSATRWVGQGEYVQVHGPEFCPTRNKRVIEAVPRLG